MKEKYVVPAYGHGSWRKTDTFSRTVYVFSRDLSFGEKVLSLVIKASFVGMIITAAVVIF